MKTHQYMAYANQGAGAGFFGSSGIPLAIWCAERILCGEESSDISVGS